MFSGGEANESDTRVNEEIKVVEYEPPEPPKNESDTVVEDITSKELHPVWIEGSGNSW